MRKVFLDNLPKKNKNINWKLSVGHKVKFIYEDIEGSLKIIKYIIKNNHPYLEVEYNDKTYLISSGEDSGFHPLTPSIRNGWILTKLKDTNTQTHKEDNS